MNSKCLRRSRWNEVGKSVGSQQSTKQTSLGAIQHKHTTTAAAAATQLQQQQQNHSTNIHMKYVNFVVGFVKYEYEYV